MNDKFEGMGQWKLLSDSLIMLIRIVGRSSKKFFEQAYYYCQVARFVNNMFVGLPKTRNITDGTS